MSSTIYHSTPTTGKSPLFSRHSNSAGAPLPFIPRRGSNRSITTVQSLFPSREETTPTQARVTIEPPAANTSSQDSEESTSSSSDSFLQFDAGGTKSSPGNRPHHRGSPEQSASTPAVHTPPESVQSHNIAAKVVNESNNETPRSSARGKAPQRSGKKPNLSINLDLIDPQTWSSPALSNLVIPPSAEAQLLRKKSGEPLKSSLKSKPSSARGNLSIITGGRLVSSRSEPSTPNHARCKSVQFAQQLERVKLFLAEQKPLAVSRDGSPIDDTSGTETDFPEFIYGTSDDDRENKSLMMEIVNMPKRGSPSVDVMLEDLSLSQDATIHGHIKVRNLAFQKWVAVRFTFDWWQTTSEVTAKYVQSLDAGAFDRFSFLFKIHEILSKIEEKTLFLAVRYSVDGQEIWDNNGGQNYQIKFSVLKQMPLKQGTPENLERPCSPGIADLKNKLEQVADRKLGSVGTFLTNRRQETKSETLTSLPDKDTFSFSSDMPLSSRYDFSTSSKKPWKPIDYPRSQSPVSHMRMSTHPASSPRGIPSHQKRAFYASTPRIEKLYSRQFTRGSPRIDGDESVLSVPMIQDEDVDVVEDDQISVQSFRALNRNRDLEGICLDDFSSQMSSVNIAAQKSPVDVLANTETIQRYHPFSSTPQTSSANGYRTASDSSVHDSSDDPTPSVTSTSSDSQSPWQSFSPLPDLNGFSKDGLEMNPRTDMTSFLDKFCFYTGPGLPLDLNDDHLQRSQSASSIEQLLYSSPPQHSPSSAHYRTFMYNRQSPSLRSRSSSYDDVSVLSGSSTPTPGSTSRMKPALAF